MEKIIEVDIVDKYDLVEKYDKSTVSEQLIDYILTKAAEYPSNSNYKIIISKKGPVDHDATKLIYNGIENEYNNAILLHRKVNYKQLLYVAVGLISIILSTLIDQEVFKEILIIGAWVPLWEAIDLALFSEPEERRNINMLKKLMNCEIIEK